MTGSATSSKGSTMTSSTCKPPVPDHTKSVVAAAPPGTEADRSIHGAAITVGVGILVMSVLAGFGKRF